MAVYTALGVLGGMAWPPPPDGLNKGVFGFLKGFLKGSLKGSLKESRGGLGFRGHMGGLLLEASKGGMKVGRPKDPINKDYLGITPPTFIPPLEPFDSEGTGFRAV